MDWLCKVWLLGPRTSILKHAVKSRYNSTANWKTALNTYKYSVWTPQEEADSTSIEVWLTLIGLKIATWQTLLQPNSSRLNSELRNSNTTLFPCNDVTSYQSNRYLASGHISSESASPEFSVSWRCSGRLTGAELEGGVTGSIPILRIELTPWNRLYSEKSILAHLLKKFPAFNGTGTFIIVFTGTCYWSLSPTRWVQYKPYILFP